MEELMLGDLVQMRKTHPCGSDKWTVIRVGADIKIRCQGCSRIVMMDRADFMKRMKKILDKEGLLKTIRDQRYFEKPCVKARKKSQRARIRNRSRRGRMELN